MWQFSQKAEDFSDLESLLIEVRRMLGLSEESVWAPLTPQVIVSDIDEAIALIKSKKRPDIQRLEIHFAPTSSIQEIAMANGWGEEFLVLSEKFDSIILSINR